MLAWLELHVIQVDRNTVVSLCDKSGIALRPWVEAGYRAVCVDVSLPPGEELRDGVWWVGGDVRSLNVLRGSPFGVFAFPPCTHLASVGQSSWESKGEAALLDALSIVDSCIRYAVMSRAEWWLLENPVGRLTHYLGTPSYVFSPHEYGGYLLPAGDAYTKRTCLWTGGSFLMPERRCVEPVQGSLVEKVSDVDRRSETPRGFARAVFETLRPANLFQPWHSFPAAESCRPGQPLRPADERPCQWCGRVLRGRSDRRFCSMRCRVAAHRNRVGQDTRC